MKPELISGTIILAFAAYFGYHDGYVRPQDALGQVAKQRREAEQVRELRTRVAATLTTFEQQRHSLPRKLDPDWLMQEIGRLAREVGVHITSLTPQAPRQFSDGTLLSVSVNFTTSYHNLGQFVSRLESSGALLRIDELELTPDPGRQGTGVANIRLLVSTLYVPPVLEPVGR